MLEYLTSLVAMPRMFMALLLLAGAVAALDDCLKPTRATKFWDVLWAALFVGAFVANLFVPAVH